MNDPAMSVKLAEVRPMRTGPFRSKIAPPTLQFGDVKIWSVIDGTFTYPGAPGYPAPDSREFAPHRRYVHEGYTFLDVGGFLVQTADRLVLIDAGTGPGDGHVHRPTVAESDSWWPLEMQSGLLELSLHRLGFQPSDVTDVFLSHLHFDHTGWLSVDGRPFFSNAVVRCEANDAEYFTNSEYDDGPLCEKWHATSMRKHADALGAKFEPWQEDSSLAPSIRALFSPGHTPGSTVFSITSGGEEALILGDCVHCPQELCESTYTESHRPHSDMDMARANTSRQLVRERAVAASAHLSSPHFPGLAFGRLSVGSSPRQWHFAWN